MLPLPLLPRRSNHAAPPWDCLQSLGLLLGLILSCGLASTEALAQRPFLAHDALYRSETAQRVFFDGYAFTAEVSYRQAGEVQGDGRPTIGSNPLGLAFRLDYQLAKQIDLSAIVDASGSSVGSSGSVAGRSLSISWVALKYYWTVDNSDYAFRLAVDPSLDGRTGFSQTDFAFFANTLLSPIFSTDFAIGARRVQRGYERYELRETTAGGDDDPQDLPPPQLASPSDLDLFYTRAMGWELHLMMSYNVLFDPAGSNLFGSLIVNRGQYELSDFSLDDTGTPTGSGTGTADSGGFYTSEYRGGAVWLRTGVEYNRPAYQVAPFLNWPVKHWTPSGNNAPRIHVGVRLMLR